MTVFEWLKLMTKEQFGRWINWEYSRCDWCNPEIIDNQVNCGDKDCKECILDWLDSPANEPRRVDETT